MKRTFILEDLDCAHCAKKIEEAVAKIDGRLYQFQPRPDYEKSTMTYDPREKVWKGVIMIIQIDFGEINDDASSTPQMEKYILSPMLKIEFNTTKRIK